MGIQQTQHHLLKTLSFPHTSRVMSQASMYVWVCFWILLCWTVCPFWDQRHPSLWLYWTILWLCTKSWQLVEPVFHSLEHLVPLNFHIRFGSNLSSSHTHTHTPLCSSLNFLHPSFTALSTGLEMFLCLPRIQIVSTPRTRTMVASLHFFFPGPSFLVEWSAGYMHLTHKHLKGLREWEQENEAERALETAEYCAWFCPPFRPLECMARREHKVETRFCRSPWRGQLLYVAWGLSIFPGWVWI